MLEQIRKTDRRITPGHFVPGVAGQYQQAPSPLGGVLVKAGWFRRYTAEEAPPFEPIVQSWDTASKATEPAPTLPSPARGGGKGGGARSGGYRARIFI